MQNGTPALGAPEVGLGDNGDLYMDVANALLPIYQKVGGNWMFLANVKQPPAGGGGGGGGSAAGDGGAIIIYPGPNPPDKDNEGRPIDIGDIWFDPTTGLIFIWNGSNWLPASDHPPVIISPTPPEYNNSSDGTTNYPVQDGDLWLDPDGNILYIYRDGVWSEVTACGAGSVEGFLKKYGDEIQDAQGNILYSWNEDVEIVSDKSLTLTGTTEKIDRTIYESDGLKQITNKEYVDDRDGILQREIIELAEEINALSPVMERGLFISTAGATGPGEGEFFIRNAGGKTIDYTDPTVNNIIISKKDKDGGDHFFTDVEVGDLLHLFEEGPDNGLYEITAIAGNSSPTDPAVAVTFDVNLISGFGEATVGDVARLRISKPPSGGDASTFLSKYGERVIDATAACNYEWNESVSIKSAGSIDVEPARDNSVTITTQNGSSQDVEVFTISNPLNTKFSVNSNGTISTDATNVFIAQEDHHLTTKKFVDDKFDFSQYQELS